jgi:hypothetical protein
MQLNDPSVYMRLRGYSPKITLECAACPTHFPADEGVAFPVKNKEGEYHMAAFCSHACYLRAMPLTACGRG